MSPLTKAAIREVEMAERDSTFVKVSIYIVVAAFVVVFAVQAVEHLAK